MVHVLDVSEFISLFTEKEAFSGRPMVVGLCEMHVLSDFNFDWLELMFLHEIVLCYLIVVPFDLIVAYLHGVKVLLPDYVALGVVLVVNSDLHPDFHVINGFVSVAVDHEPVNFDIVLNWDVHNRLVV